MARSIDDYRAKRDFSKTPEPSPTAERVSRPDDLVFVVHRHDATRLHYDLRLEMEGVLRSWAVPKGFSYHPEDRRLAVRTEDHPFEYLDFEGVIPKGEYGAGTMTIWDRGRYRILNADGFEGSRNGKLEIELYGRRLRGEWHLVLTRGTSDSSRREKSSSGQEEWLIFKGRDLYARGPDEAIGGDLRSAPEAPFPRQVAPMEAGQRASQAFSDPHWIFEMLFEGMRVQLFISENGPRLVRAPAGAGREQSAGDTEPAREHGTGDTGTGRAHGGGDTGSDRGRARTKKRGTTSGDRGDTPTDFLSLFPEIAKEVGKLRVRRALLDGVLVALDDTGRPSLEALAARMRGDNERPVQLYLFDVLHYEEFDVRQVPLVERKAHLASIVPKLRAILYVDHVPGSGENLARVVEHSGLPGLMAKRADSAYVSGRSPDWMEIALSANERARQQALHEALASTGGDYRPVEMRVKFTNLKKVYWPDQGYTKGDLIGYYEQVADLILPYLRERPCHLLRYPDGVEGQSFYQHEAPSHLPDWFETIPIESESKGRAIPHMICNDRASLLYLVNLGSIDLHPWFSRRGSLWSPDWAVIDLDPKEAPFRDVIRVARAVKKVLDAIAIQAYLKTSGKTGMHICIPLRPGYTYDQSRMFCESIARVVAQEHPDVATVERATQKRKSRVYVDFGQNREGQTIVPPYVVRPVPAATVSTPLHWDELDSELDPGLFHLRSVLPRLARVGEMFRPVLENGQDLLPAIGKLEGYLKR